MERLKRALEIIPDMYDKGLLDASGGNLAIRASRGIYVTPSQAGEMLRWKIALEDFVHFPGEGDASIARAARRPSRESRLHRALLAARPDWNFVYHGHPWGLLAFAIAAKSMPVPAAFSNYLGHGKALEIPVVEALPSGSPQLAHTATELMVREFKGSTHGAALLAGHGVVVVGAEVESVHTVATGLENVARAQIWRLARA